MKSKLGRKKANREHLVRNIATSLVMFEYVETTQAKAKEAKRYLEQLIARNKDNDLSAKRRVLASLFDRNASRKLLNELLPRYENKKSGFIHSYRLKNRPGDNAPMVRLELVDKKVFVTPEAEVKVKENKLAEKVKETPNDAK